MSLSNPRRIFNHDHDNKSTVVRCLLKLTIIFILVAGLWASGLFWFVKTAREYQNTPAQTMETDAIVVLTGGSNRLPTGFELLEQGKAEKLFISGVYQGVEVAELMKLWKDLPDKRLECCVVLGYEANNTTGNAAETAAWLEKENYKSFYLVTATYHMKRALLEFDDLAKNHTIIPYPVTPEGLDMNSWWRHPPSKKLVIREYNKYLLTLVRTALWS